MFNEWKLSSIVTAGSGRPVNATVSGDPNQDGNYDNDRLPGYSRNAFTGPDYASADLRLVRKIHVAQGYRLEFTADSFNLFNHDNQRVEITSDGLTAEATTFVQYTVVRQRSSLPRLLPATTGFSETQRRLRAAPNPAGVETGFLILLL